jgi:cell division cycle protein 37
MPLNYSKWDALELSDDSDIEGHPNVDHKSLVRMKQRQIHEQREMRKRQIAQLQLDISVHEALRPRLQSIIQEVKTGGRATYSQTVDRLRASGGKEDGMLVDLLMKVSDEAKAAARDSDKLDSALVDGLQKNYDLLIERLEKDRKKLAEELAEQGKKITSDDLHESWESKVC